MTSRKVKFLMEDYYYNANSLVLELIRRVIRRYDYEKLNELLPVHVGHKLVTTLADARYESREYKRYFLNEEDILTDKNGNRVAVTNQWSIANAEKFLKHYKAQFGNVKVKLVMP